jgi:hypothetical protein
LISSRFIPERSVDLLYYDKPYFLAPDKRGAKPYSLLLPAMTVTGALRVGQVGVAVKEIRGTGAALRGRPGAAAVALRRRGATSQPSVLDPNHDSASSSVLAQPTMSTPASLLENR